MFFTAYWRDKVLELERTIAALKARERAHAEHAATLLSTLQMAQTNFAKLADQYTEGLERARKIAEEAEAVIQNPPFSSTRLHSSEEEEDLRWDLDTGALSVEQYNEALRSAGITTE